MGQGESGQAASAQANAHAPTKLTEKEVKEIEEYEKIVRFRDAVLSGNHPTIKLPDGLLKALPNPIAGHARSPSEPGEVDTRPQALQSFSASNQVQNPSVPQPLAEASASAKATDSQQPKPFGSGTTEINPIFLEKSDELVRAELQLQRQRLERSLREEFEQHRVSKQVQAEPVIEFDLSDVLAKALTIVQATTIPFTANGAMTANHSAASDSFDDNTFYSSQHQTPDSNLTSRVRRSTDDAMVIDSPRQHHSRSRESTNHGNHMATPVRNYPAAGSSSRPSYQATGATASRPRIDQVPGLHLHANSGNPQATAQGPAAATRTEPKRPAETQRREPEISAAQLALNQPAQPHPPLIRNHDLIPVAPQPAKIAPLTVVNVQTPVVDSALATSFGTSAQVAALRHEPPTVASSDTSSQGGKDADRRKAKRKKRKADRQAPEAEASPRIKAEPRSQSPLIAPAYTRPSKRQRQSQGHANESGQSEQRYVQPPPNTSYEQQPAQAYRNERAPTAYQGPDPAPYLPQSVSSSTLAAEPIRETTTNRDFADNRRVSGDGYIRPPPPGEGYIRQPLSRDGAPYHPPPPREIHGPGAAPQVIAYDPYREPIRIYREPLEGPRASARPEGESFIVPPRPPTRVMVDSYGREYVEPVLPSARQSVAPLPRSGEPEVIYERLPPPRSLNSAAGPYNEGNVVYTRPLSVYDPVKRVYVSQPDYPYDHRDGQYREHQLQQRGYIQIVGPERRVIEERPAEYLPRGVGLRPSDRMRFEPGQPYYRMHSARPEAPGREYTGSVHPIDGRHQEAPQPYAREYGGSPMQRPPTGHREYSVRPSERYHESQGPARGSDEIAFIERPRGATREIVYVDDVREVYR
ncbi:hypothetical protein TARUN_6274 [Trichoderma arundinaceum]|uniref:Uncharacterized protein n=1 Tax=Trichoderma arundinaceum TaxID=490622 RepID=A0A395NIM8_TRIAR|nr:hypothetical protein TARUN_6274 [Trichoderma arundinaceum]